MRLHSSSMGALTQRSSTAAPIARAASRNASRSSRAQTPHSMTTLPPAQSRSSVRSSWNCSMRLRTPSFQRSIPRRHHPVIGTHPHCGHRPRQLGRELCLPATREPGDDDEAPRGRSPCSVRSRRPCSHANPCAAERWPALQVPLGGVAGRRDRPSARVALLVKRQPGRTREDVVGSEKWCADVERRCRDPQVVGVGSIMERVARSATGESELGEGREESIADGNDRGHLDRLIEAVAPRRAPSGHESAISESLTVMAARKVCCPAIKPICTSNRARRRRLSDTLNTPVSTSTLTNRAQRRRPRPRPRTTPRSGARR